MVETNLIVNARYRMVIPFYISDINDKFFISLNNHPSKYFVQKVLPVIKKNLDEDDWNEFEAIESLTKSERIRLMLNLALKKIRAKTGSESLSLFENFECENYFKSTYITQVDENTVNEPQISRRYNFHINLNQDSYFGPYLNQIEISFYLDEDNKIVSGGFMLNLENDNPNLSFSESVRKIYVRSLIQNFLMNQIYPFSLNNLLQLVDETNVNKLKTKGRKKFTPFNIETIKNNWNSFVHNKYLKYINTSSEQKKYYYDDLFFSIMNSLIIVLCLFQELKIYFTSKTPELILGLLSKTIGHNERKEISAEQDFFSLLNHIQSQYFSERKIVNLKKIKDAEDLIETIATVKADYGHESIVDIVPIYDFVINHKDIIVNPVSLLEENQIYLVLYLLVIKPRLFGIHYESAYFIHYRQFMNIVENYVRNKPDKNQLMSYNIIECNGEINHNLVTYLSNESVLIFCSKNENKIYFDYYWALIYARSLEWIKNDIEFDFDNDQNPKKNSLLYDHKIHTLENLVFDWYDDFYGLDSIKPIVYKIDQLSNLKSSIELLISRMSDKNAIYKKEREIGILINAFAVAALIGFNNFFGMIYTILSVGNSPQQTSVNIAVIVISTMFCLLLLTIVGKYFYLIVKQKRWIRKNRGE